MTEIEKAPARANLTVAVVRDPNLVASSKNVPANFAAAIGDAIARGVADAAGLVVRTASVVDRAPAGGYDLVVTPSNALIEMETTQSTISVDVTIRRARDGREFGILIEGIGRVGPRETATVEPLGGKVHIAGSYLKNPPAGQALNNALFAVTRDFLHKFERRLPSFE
ncbi:hypothetical protein K8I61_13765 [bacterium]|nr:hypothetical protein [bacterium]